jgi:hypothetical protein
VNCSVCLDNFCEVCFAAQHRKGSRKRHATTSLGEETGKKAKIAKEDAHRGSKQAEDNEDAKVCTRLLPGFFG